MSRPHKATVDYFPHDTAATSGKTLFTLQGKFGNDGYAFWFKLLELLGRSEGHVFDYNSPAEWGFLLAITAVSEDTATNIIQTLVDLDAIDRELASKKIIWCQHFVDNIADAYKRRQVGLPLRPGSSTKPQEPEPEPKPKLQTVSKKPHGSLSNVLLTSDEYSKLQERFSDTLPDKIENLSLGIEAHGYKYKSHYAALLKWDKMESSPGGKFPGKPSPKIQPRRTYDDGYEGMTIIDGSEPD